MKQQLLQFLQQLPAKENLTNHYLEDEVEKLSGRRKKRRGEKEMGKNNASISNQATTLVLKKGDPASPS